MEWPAGPMPPAWRQLFGSAQSNAVVVFFARDEAIELVCAFYRISDATLRRLIITVISLLGS